MRIPTGRRWLRIALPIGVLSTLAVVRAQEPPARGPTAEDIKAAHQTLLAAAAEYEFHVGKDKEDRPLELVREPKLKWSNPARSDIQGVVFLWTREGRPLVVGSLHRWFTLRSPLVMQHEFHSLAEGPLRAKFHGDAVWHIEEAGVTFVAVPGAPAPAANKVQRPLQLRKLAQEFSATAHYRNATSGTELRLLPRPIASYAAPKQGTLEGGLFAFVRGTDPEMFLLIEARGRDAATARWQFAAARMTNMAELRLRHQEKQVWEGQLLPWKDVSVSHSRAYTAFSFDTIPGFLKEAIPKPDHEPR